MTWDPPDVNSNAGIDDYVVYAYDRHPDGTCQRPTDILTDDTDRRRISLGSARFFDTQIDSYGKEQCIEVVSVNSMSMEESYSRKVTSPAPYKIPGVNDFYSWIRGDIWGNQATLFWKAAYPSQIAYFEILKLPTSSASCSRVNNDLQEDPFTLDSFGSDNTFTRTVELGSGANYFCIIVTYNDGNERRLTYTNQRGDNLPFQSGTINDFNFDSIELGPGESNNLKLTMNIRTRNYAVTSHSYDICLDIRLPESDN